MPTSAGKMVRAAPGRLPVVLFGYDASAFTTKARMTLKLKQIPYTYITVPSMMPRPILKDNFGITYRKIPVLAIGKDFYADTSLIMEALEHQFPVSEGFGTIYPVSPGDRSYRPMMRGFASFWTDLPFYRVAVGVVPGVVWRSSFGKDRGDLIGHPLDADKLERKIPQQLSGLDLHFSIIEPQLKSSNGQVPWVFDTKTPSSADISMFFMLYWAKKISKGEDLANLTNGEVPDGSTGESIRTVFNESRYPNLWKWYRHVEMYWNNLKEVETRVEGKDTERVNSVLAELAELQLPSQIPLLETPGEPLQGLDQRNGLYLGAYISVTPDNTGRNAPTYGRLAALTPEEIVIGPAETDGKSAPYVDNLRVHFPRVGFVAKPVEQARL